MIRFGVRAAWRAPEFGREGTVSVMIGRGRRDAMAAGPGGPGGLWFAAGEDLAALRVTAGWLADTT
jgi:hypothetical protein